MNNNSSSNNGNEALIAMQNQIKAMQNRIALANQAAVSLSAQTQTNSLKSGWPNKFNGKNAKAWFHSSENIFNIQNDNLSEEQKIQYAIS